jgi:LDH2 family malate/lactate/ureidoglycolate dehydrogenase
MSVEASKGEEGIGARPIRASAVSIKEFATNVLVAAGTAPDVARSVADALTETSLRGVDSHGIRLLVHYAKVVKTGRINPKPELTFTRTGQSTAMVDADNGFGHHASLFAINHAIALTQESGIAAISVVNSSHFGSAGSYVLPAAEQGYVALGVCNSDSFVLPHDGIEPFHGTNPLAFAAPVIGSRPFLVDMATSVIPWNRVQDLMNEGLALPPDVAVDMNGTPTRVPSDSAALLPLGGINYGYKGAALASMVEVLSAVMTGMPHCSRLLAMAGPNLVTHRHLGHFFIVIDPRRFVSSEIYNSAMNAYLDDLRAVSGRNGIKVMAPGDREWAVEQERQLHGIPVADQLKIDLDELADSLGVERLVYIQLSDFPNG